MRSDAEANRQRLLKAGRLLVQEHGGDLPIERFCDTAGVNRATFYRHFSDRSALYNAMCDHELALMARALDDAKHPLAFMIALAEMMMVFDRFVTSLADIPEFSATPANNRKVWDAVAPSLARAKADGWIYDHITADDIFVIARMIGCSWRLDHQPSREAALERRLRLVLDGLSPRKSFDA